MGTEPRSTEAMSPCPACGADKVGTFTADNAFLYGLSCPVRLVAKDVEHFRCMGCGVEFTGEDGERKREQAVRDHLARSPPGASGCGHVPAGYSCVTPGCSNGPAPEPEDLRAEVERLRVERYLCVLAMRCAMGAHHDGVDAMRERLEPVVARYGIATACAARAAISDADAACIEAQYSRSEIAGSSGEPVAKPNPCRNECSLISLDDDHWKCNHCDAVFAYTGAQKPVEKPRCWWPLCKETAGDALCDAVQSALTKGEKP